MTLQQLRYLIAIAECGSISAAAHQLFVAQSSLSVAVKEIESEAGVTVFQRSNRGITLTTDGVELLGYARQVVEQADLMERRYSQEHRRLPQRLALSTQHYAFCVQAFIDFVDENKGDAYDFILRETRTGEIIQDVQTFRSDLGVLYLSSFNERVITKALNDAGLTFHTLFKARPHIFVSEHHPLASREIIHVEDLAEYPRYSFEQGSDNSFYYAEEPLSSLPHSKKIAISDRGTLSNLLANHDGYTVSTGILSKEMHTGIASVPLDIDETMRVGYILHSQRTPSPLANRYLEKLKEAVAGYGDLR